MTLSSSIDMPSATRTVSDDTPALWRRWLREPLLHFVLIGLILFAVGEWYRKQSDTHRIEITPQRIAQLSRRYELQFGAAPNTEVLSLLVDEDIHDEMLFREGLGLKLDQDDEIVRRRLIQKTQFLLQDTHAPAEPTALELQQYYTAHQATYAIPMQASFTHVYFAAQGSDAATRERASAALAKLSNKLSNEGRAPTFGDAFPDLYDFAAYEPEQVVRLFGHSEFSEAVSTAPLDRWSGPYRSVYGWHLLRISARTPAREATLSEVRDQVRADYLRDAQTRANAAAFDAIARKYTVVRIQS